jgi:UDP-glucose 4-epimerase
MKILITGGAGFVGQALIRRLEREHELTVLDTAAAPGPLARVHERVRWISGSVLDGAALAAAVRGQQVVYHLAAALGVRACQEDEGHVARVNRDGTQAVIGAAHASGTVEHILFTSSSEIYGDGEAGRIFRETDRPAPRSAYGKSKVAGESLMAAAAVEAPHLSYTGFRLFNAYGPAQRADFVVPGFCRAALRKEQLVVHGDGQQTRTFTYVDDIVEAMVASSSIRASARGEFEVYNLVSDETVTINTLADMVCMCAGRKPDVVHRQHEDPSVGRSLRFEVSRRVADNTKARSTLGFVPRTSLSEGLRRTVEAVAAELQDPGA